ncbi:MAG: hypothetical protein ABIE14_01065 [Patescibacteria group bacterium]
MKKIQAKMRGQLVWILMPDILWFPFVKDKNFSPLDIFCYFGQFCRVRKKISQKKLIIFKKQILFDLNNRVMQLKFFAEEMKKQNKKLPEKSELKKRVYDEKPFQEFFALTNAHLDTIHSIRELILKIEA